METSEVVLCETRGAVATITLNRPDVFNAFNDEMRKRLRETVERINADEAVRIVVLKGEGRGFSAGADLGEGLSGSVTEQIEQEYKPFLTGIAESPKIWIASVHGSAAGIGAALAMTCDMMVMADDANIYLAFAAIGLIPDGGATWLLLNAMGYRRALQTIVEGRKIPAQECLSLGLANKVADAGKVHSIAQDWAEQLAEGAPLAQSCAKRVLRAVGHMTYADAVSLEAVEQQALTESEDCRNAIAAFFAKKAPVFEGR